MFVVIRADASSQIGSGHVMRCIALAESLIEKRHEVVFVCAPLFGNLIEVLRERKFEVWPLSSEINCKGDDSWDWNSDANDTLQLIGRHGREVDWFFIDHYQLDSRWHALVSASGAKIAVLDDLANRKCFCHIIIDQNSISKIHDNYRLLVPARCVRLMGAKYTLLRKDIRQVAKQRALQKYSFVGEGILVVFMGGADAGNNTLSVLKAIDIDSLRYALHVLIGPMNPWASDVMAWCRSNDVEFSIALSSVGDLLNKARAAIVACGMFAVELQALEIPCILVPVSDIQNAVAHYFCEHGRAIVMFPESLSDADALARAMNALLDLPYKTLGEGVVAVDGAHEIVRYLEMYK